MKVGRDDIYTPSKRKFAYRDIKLDPDGWADVNQYLPADFDLLLMKMSDGTIKPGWRIGNDWDGIRLNPLVQVIAWKKNPDSPM